MASLLCPQGTKPAIFPIWSSPHSPHPPSAWNRAGRITPKGERSTRMPIPIQSFFTFDICHPLFHSREVRCCLQSVSIACMPGKIFLTERDVFLVRKVQAGWWLPSGPEIALPWEFTGTTKVIDSESNLRAKHWEGKTRGTALFVVQAYHVRSLQGPRKGACNPD